MLKTVIGEIDVFPHHHQTHLGALHAFTIATGFATGFATGYATGFILTHSFIFFIVIRFTIGFTIGLGWLSTTF